MPLRARLTAAFLVVVLGPVLLGAVFIGAAVNTVSAGRAVDRLDAAADSVTAATRSQCDRLTSTAAAVAVLLGEDTAAVGSALQRAVSVEGMERVWLEDADGEVIAEAGTEAEMSRYADCDDPRAVWGVDGLVAGVDVLDAEGETVGRAKASFRIDASFVASLAEVAGAAVIIDDGRNPPLSSYGRDDAHRARQGLRLADKATAAEPVVTGETGLMVRAVEVSEASPVPYVVAIEEDSGRELFGVLVIVVVVAGLLAVAAAAWLARSTTRPMSQLADGAEAIARGDLTVRVPVHGNDELAGLARSFNRMARETQGYVQALTASRDQLRGQLTLLGETLSSTLDLERILEVIVDTAVVATGARAGVMVLVDPENSQMLVGHVAESMARRGVRPTDIRIPVGEGLLGEVAARNRAFRGRVGEPGMPTLSPREPGCARFIAVPVVSLSSRGEGTDATGGPSGLLGVLAVYDRPGDDEFDDTDLMTLRTFAGQAAVAVGNVLSHREAQRLSLTDPLTGLWNYRFLRVSLAREVERAGRFHRRVAVIVIDLDKFKEVNDTYGHLAGDTVLTEVARRINGQIRDVDLAFRYGGEEFVVLLPEADAAGAERVAQRLWQAVRREPVVIESSAGQPVRSIEVTVSLGVAVFPDHGDDGPHVLAAADEALYSAKAGGRDTWRVTGG